MMDIDDNLIKEVVERVLAVTRPEKIILFGSAATGHMGPDSDLDLLVIEQGVANAREESTRLREALIGVDIPVDIFPMELERFEETKNVIGGLAFPANKYGVVIYEAP
jgi:predicted nucleotidyltransferase